VLINNPGMIDDLMDSLVVDRPQSALEIKADLAALCRGAEDLAPILLGFRNKEWMRIGTRDILGREPIRDVTRELADVAEAVVVVAARYQWNRRAVRFGTPRRPHDGKRSRWAVLALGKLGGRELNYHSDLDLVFVHEGDGRTGGGPESEPNEVFMTEVVRRLLKTLAGTESKSAGSLYVVDTRLRPHGASGPLIVTLDAFREYFETQAKPWERLALTRARVVYSTGGFRTIVTDTLRSLIAMPESPAALARAVISLRRKLEATRGATRRQMKRRPGALADIEFLVQYLQLVHAVEFPEIVAPNLWDALDLLRQVDLIDAGVHATLTAAYSFLRTVESRLRIVHNRSGVGLPEETGDLLRLARRLYYQNADPDATISAFRADAARYDGEAQALFHQFVGRLAGETLFS
jgi:glutamate-ammonia-ligase adenylyltransferase